MLQVTGDMWHLTHDTWHVSRDIWHMTSDSWGRWNFSQNFSSLALTVWESSFDEDILTQSWLTEWMSYKGVYRTAPTTSGLLKLDGVGPIDNRPYNN